MLLVFYTIIGAAVLAFVSYPLLTKRPSGAEEGSTLKDGLADLTIRKEQIYASIRDANFDFRMGKLLEDDHGQLVDEYKLEAAAILQEIDRLNGRRKRRKAHTPTPGKRHIICPQCHRENPSNHHYCANCGSKLDSVCPSCGNPYDKKDQFCANCGAKLQTDAESQTT